MSGSHRRLNLLTGEWILVSPGRLQRPWQGKQEAAAPKPPAYDPDCYLCPGNLRANGERNPPYDSVYLFPNDYPALSAISTAEESDALLLSQPLSGECQVLCYSPRHDLHLSDLDLPQIETVIEAWAAAWRTYDVRPDIAYALIFENRGAAMGASNPHPHGQIWATSLLPDAPARELEQQSRYFERHGRPLLADYAERELAAGERVVWRGAHWLIIVPYWAEWPFETLLLPLRPIADFDALTSEARRELALALRTLIALYDKLFDTPFPYSMGWHLRPCDGQPHPEWVLHAHFSPPLLRSASVRKHQVGFEMFGMKQRDITPEDAAERLRRALEKLS